MPQTTTRVPHIYLQEYIQELSILFYLHSESSIITRKMFDYGIFCCTYLLICCAYITMCCAYSTNCCAYLPMCCAYYLLLYFLVMTRLCVCLSQNHTLALEFLPIVCCCPWTQDVIKLSSKVIPLISRSRRSVILTFFWLDIFACFVSSDFQPYYCPWCKVTLRIWIKVMSV